MSERQMSMGVHPASLPLTLLLPRASRDAFRQL